MQLTKQLTSIYTDQTKALEILRLFWPVADVNFDRVANLHRRTAMSVLNGLKLVAAKQERQTNPVQIRRAKLMAALDEQIALAKARQAGESYTATRAKRAKRVKDDAGNVSVQRVAKRLKAWFWAVEGGRVCVAVRYGNKVMELGKGKTAVETAAGELVGTTSPRI
jgi:hypothetical protein